MYNGILVIKKNETMLSATTWMELDIIILSEVGQRNIVRYHLCVESKKIIQMNVLTKQIDSDIENNPWLLKEKGERMIN